MFETIKGINCPACGNETLFVANGNYITCSWHVCPNPSPDYADAIQRLIVNKQIEILQRVKGMGVWTDDINNPNNHFVWSWKLDREINELQATLNLKQEKS